MDLKVFANIDAREVRSRYILGLCLYICRRDMDSLLKQGENLPGMWLHPMLVKLLQLQIPKVAAMNRERQYYIQVLHQ
jgi:hypothetical protein